MGVVTSELFEPLVLPDCLNALRDAAQVQHAGEADDRRRKLPVLVVGLGGVDELLVDLEDVDWQAADVVQRGVPGAEVIAGDRRPRRR